MGPPEYLEHLRVDLASRTNQKASMRWPFVPLWLTNGYGAERQTGLSVLNAVVGR